MVVPHYLSRLAVESEEVSIASREDGSFVFEHRYVNKRYGREKTGFERRAPDLAPISRIDRHHVTVTAQIEVHWNLLRSSYRSSSRSGASAFFQAFSYSMRTKPASWLFP